MDADELKKQAEAVCPIRPDFKELHEQWVNGYMTAAVRYEKMFDEMAKKLELIEQSMAPPTQSH